MPLVADRSSAVVSVVIPTRNAGAHLQRCLTSLLATRAAIEVIVVDQGSDDDTAAIAAKAGTTILQAPPTSLYTPPTRSRNIGAADAHGRFLLHLDADMSLARDWLEEGVELCAEDRHVALVVEEVDISEGYWGACKALERRTYRSSALEGARFVRADVFRRVGGYDEAIGSGEDWDIHARYAAEGSIGRLSNGVEHHLGEVSFSAQVAKKFAYGRSAGAFVGKHDTGAFGLNMLEAYARSWRMFAADPTHAAGFVALRLGEAAAVSAGLVTERLSARRSSSRSSAG